MIQNIGEVIVKKRKAKSWTQEHLANAVGVSTPAVSKWETGTTYPDITLLAPIARALNTSIDELFSYQNELSSDEVSELIKEAVNTYESKGFDAGWVLCQKLMQEYPNSIPLKFQLGGLFQNFLLLKPELDNEDMLAYYRSAANIEEEVLSSGHPKYTFLATIALAGYYVILNKLERAEELLDGLPKIEIDTDLLYPSIYALRGKHDEAIKLTQENIRRYIPLISLQLELLCSDAREHGEFTKAYTLAKINFDMAKLFGICEETVYSSMIKALASQGDMQNALNYFEAYTQKILELNYDYSNNPVFDRLPEQPSIASYLKKVLAESVLLDEEYAPLKSEIRYQQAISKLRKIVGSKTSI